MSPRTPSEKLFDESFSRRTFLQGLAGATLFSAGCGSQTYEARLRETKLYFEYIDQVNLALQRPVKFEGIEIRVPKPFEQLLPAKIPEEGQPPEKLDPLLDPVRLGYFPNVVLEGVLATWKANVRVEVPGQANSGEAPAYLHLLSNWQRWIDKQADTDIEPPRYLSDLANHLATTFNVQPDGDVPWNWEPVRAMSPYVPKKKVESIPIELPQPPINVIFYKTENRDVHVALLLILPRAIDPREKLEARLKHTLETIKIPSQPPQKPSPKATSGGF